MRLVVVAVVACVLLAGCEGISRITNSTYQDGVRCMTQAISGDGRWVAYSTMGDPSGIRTDQQTRLHDRRTGRSVQLYGLGSNVTQGASVDADGSDIVFRIAVRTSSSSEDRVYVYKRATGQRTRISPVGESAFATAISGDGKKVAYAVEQKGIYLYDAIAKTRKRVSPVPASSTDYEAPRLSTSGRIMTYVKYTGPTTSIQLVVRDNQTGNEWSLLSGSERADAGAVVSGDGRWVVYTKAHPGLLGGRSQVYVWDRTTHTSRRITSVAAGTAVGDATISADGSTLAYLQYQSGQGDVNHLVRVDRASGATSVAVTGNHFLHGPAIDADGHAIAFCTDATNLVAHSPQAPNVYVATH